MRNVTAAQLRMARAALRWSLADVREHTGLAPKTLRKLEHGPADLMDRTWPATVHKLISCYEEQGITFVDADQQEGVGDGVRYNPPLTEHSPVAALCS